MIRRRSGRQGGEKGRGMRRSEETGAGFIEEGLEKVRVGGGICTRIKR